MKKISFSILVLCIVCTSMIYFVANMAEKEIKNTLSQIQYADFSTQLISYQRGFFSSKAVTEIKLKADHELPINFKVLTKVQHYPHQAVLNNQFELTDEAMASKATAYFGHQHWMHSVEKINLFSQLSGRLTIMAGQYESELESISTEPLVFDYQVDLKNKNADLSANLEGLTGASYGVSFKLDNLKMSSHIASLTTQGDYDYQINIDTVSAHQENSHSVLQGFDLSGHSQQGNKPETIDILNDLFINSYQINNGETLTFNKNRLKLALTGLYKPAFELINNGSEDPEIVEQALIELVNYGAQLSLSTINSQTPWGEVDGELQLALDKGASLTNIVMNPYILFDFMSGEARLALPRNLLDEPLVESPLQMSVMTGFLEVNEQTLDLQMSFQQGELTVNGRIVPLQ